MNDVLHTDNPDRPGNLTAEEYRRRLEERAATAPPCHDWTGVDLPLDVEVGDR